MFGSPFEQQAAIPPMPPRMLSGGGFTALKYRVVVWRS